jgi:hypothetical protein
MILIAVLSSKLIVLPASGMNQKLNEVVREIRQYEAYCGPAVDVPDRAFLYS